MGPFLQSFFAELSNAILKSSPPNASPKKLLSMAYVFGDEMRSSSYAFGDETPTKYFTRPTKQMINLQQISPAFRHVVADTDSATQSFPSTPSETTVSPSLPITPAEPEAPIDPIAIPSKPSRAKQLAPSQRTCLSVDNLDPTVTGVDLYELFGRDDVAFVNFLDGDETSSLSTRRAQVYFRTSESGMLLSGNPLMCSYERFGI